MEGARERERRKNRFENSVRPEPPGAFFKFWISAGRTWRRSLSQFELRVTPRPALACDRHGAVPSSLAGSGDGAEPPGARKGGWMNGRADHHSCSRRRPQISLLAAAQPPRWDPDGVRLHNRGAEGAAEQSRRPKSGSSELGRRHNTVIPQSPSYIHAVHEQSPCAQWFLNIGWKLEYGIFHLCVIFWVRRQTRICLIPPMQRSFEERLEQVLLNFKEQVAVASCLFWFSCSDSLLAIVHTKKKAKVHCVRELLYRCFKHKQCEGMRSLVTEKIKIRNQVLHLSIWMIACLSQAVALCRRLFQFFDQQLLHSPSDLLLFSPPYPV